MSISEPFIRRPIATALLMTALLVAGILGYNLLPVAALPTVDFPTISVSASLPGASPYINGRHRWRSRSNGNSRPCPASTRSPR